MKSIYAMPVVVAVLTACAAAVAVNQTTEESAETGRWVAAKFDGNPESRPDLGYLLPQLKSGLLEKNARQHHGLQIAGKPFARGLHCPSVGTLEVHLPAPGKHFGAWVASTAMTLLTTRVWAGEMSSLPSRLAGRKYSTAHS